VRTAAQAVAEARRWTTNRDDMCLFTVQQWFAAPWSGPYAEEAWRRWGGQHPGDTNPPAGVPVYWHNPRSRYGHIALSVGGGVVRSTDWPRDTRVGEVTIAELTRRWGVQYLGWSDRFSGGPIQGIGGRAAPAGVPSSAASHPTIHGEVPDMLVLARRADTGGFFLIGSAGTYQPSQADVDALVTAGLPVRALSADQIDKVGWLIRKVSGP